MRPVDGEYKSILDIFLEEIRKPMQTPAWLSGSKECQIFMVEGAKRRARERAEANKGDTMENLFCPVHKEVQEQLKEMRAKQEARHCVSHEVEIEHLQQDLGKVEEDNCRQWTAINRLRLMVYMGAGGTGVLAFLGSIIGSYLVKG